MNSTGPSIEPWGTPLKIEWQMDFCFVNWAYIEPGEDRVSDSMYVINKTEGHSDQDCYCVTELNV